MSSDCTYPAKLGMKSSTKTAIVHYKSFQRQRNLRHMSKRLTYCYRGFILRPTAVRHIFYRCLRISGALSQSARQINQALKARNRYAIEQHKSTTGNTRTTPTSPTPSPSLQPRHRHAHSRETPRQINQHATLHVSQPSPARTPPPLLTRTRPRRPRDTEPLTGTGECATRNPLAANSNACLSGEKSRRKGFMWLVTSR